jgi:hypothetical protein
MTDITAQSSTVTALLSLGTSKHMTEEFVSIQTTVLLLLLLILNSIKIWQNQQNFIKN